MSSDTQPPEKKKTRLWIPIVVGVLIVGYIGSLFDTGASEPTSESAETSQEQVSNEVETAEPEVPESFTSLDQLEAAIKAEFGSSTNMDVPRDFSISLDETDGWLNVAYVMDENLTANLTRYGAWSDTETIFLLARKAEFVKSLTITTRLPLINNLGEELGPQDIFIVYFDGEVYPRINPENLAGEMYGDAATSVFIHPAIQEQ